MTPILRRAFLRHARRHPWQMATTGLGVALTGLDEVLDVAADHEADERCEQAGDRNGPLHVLDRGVGTAETAGGDAELTIRMNKIGFVFVVALETVKFVHVNNRP